MVDDIKCVVSSVLLLIPLHPVCSERTVFIRFYWKFIYQVLKTITIFR